MTISDTAAWLRSHDNYLIITHRRPDGDTLGSAAALSRALNAIGKTAYALQNPDTTARYLPYINPYHAPQGYVPDKVITVDIASPQLFQTNFAEDSAVDLSIDHHPSNTGYAVQTLVAPACAACGELILDLISELCEVDSDMASALYIAISTDTGCFSYDNTTAETFRAAARLTDLGAPIVDLTRILFRAKSRGRIALEGEICSSLEFFFDSRVAVAILTREMRETSGAIEDDMDNIAAIPVSISGVEVGVLIRELDNGEFKISVRSNAAIISSNALCARFGGGGHAAAAGFTEINSAQAIRDKIVAALGEHYDA